MCGTDRQAVVEADNLRTYDTGLGVFVVSLVHRAPSKSSIANVSRRQLQVSAHVHVVFKTDMQSAFCGRPYASVVWETPCLRCIGDPMSALCGRPYVCVVW